MVMDVLTEDAMDVSVMDLLCVNDLVLCGESLYEVMAKNGRWKNAAVEKRLRGNVDKTKDMELLFGTRSSVSKVNPCSVCGECVGCNSIWCTKCQRWTHRLISCREVFACRTCLGHNCSLEEKLEFQGEEDALDEVEKFCYLGDMISCYVGASEAVSARIGKCVEEVQ